MIRRAQSLIVVLVMTALALAGCAVPVFPDPPSKALMKACAELPDVPPDEAGPRTRTEYDIKTRSNYVLCAGTAHGLQDYVRLVQSKSAAAARAK